MSEVSTHESQANAANIAAEAEKKKRNMKLDDLATIVKCRALITDLESDKDRASVMSYLNRKFPVNASH